MTLAGLHLQLTKQGHIQPSPEQLDANTLKYYCDRFNHAKSWQVLGAELGILNPTSSIPIEGFYQSTQSK